MWKRWAQFWNEALWNFPLSEIRGWKKSFYKWLRVFAGAVRGFHNDRCAIRASSLTFYTLMSIVPMLALFFAIARGFGVSEYLRSELLARFQEQKTALAEVIQFAELLLEETRGGLIAGIGFLILFWSAMRLLANIEDVLNHIWEIPKMRSLRMILSEYVFILLIAPLFFVLSNSTVVFAAKYLDRWVHFFPVGHAVLSILLFLIHLLPYCLFWLFFSFLYFFLPNTRVRPASAFTGGIIAGTLYLLVQWGYIFFQVGASHYGAIYGSFAALPLFLIWLQLSWFLLLFGAEISYAHQTLENYEYEPAVGKISLSLKKTVSLWILYLCIQKFRKENLPMSFHWLVHAIRIPAALGKPILHELVEAGLLLETLEHTYLPTARSINSKVSDALQALEEKGINDLPFLRSKELERFEKTLHVFKGLIEQSGENFCMINGDA
jgi:membrane protein